MGTNNDNFIMAPKIDFCFKELMEDPEVRRGLISAILGISPEEIIETTLLPTNLRREQADDKLGILDVRVRMNGNAEIDMEMQVLNFKFWQERSIFYLCKMYYDGIRKGEDYNQLDKCIHVGILNFELFEKNTEYHSCFHLWEDNRKELYSDKLELHILELPKIQKYEYENSILLRWARFLGSEKKEEMEELAKTDQYIGKAYERLVTISAEDEKRIEYEERQKAIWDFNTLTRSYYQEGREEGREEGRKQGKEEERERVNELVKKLAAAGRLDDLIKATEDKVYQEALFEEFGL